MHAQVKHGKLKFDIGYIDYSNTNTDSNIMMISIIAAVGGTILIVVILVIVVCKSSQDHYQKKLEGVLVEMQELEDAVKSEATKGQPRLLKLATLAWILKGGYF